MLKPIEWLPEGKVRFLDQTLLPNEETWIETDDHRVVGQAIRDLQIRGAPLIGIAAAYALALAAREDGGAAAGRLRAAADSLRSTRPTAVNLAWALDRALQAAAAQPDANTVREALLDEARRIDEKDIAGNRQIGDHGATLLPRDCTVLTHCNAGSLATGGYGTALGVIRSAWEQGKLRRVYNTETRPLLQGARLTAWELQKDGIPSTLIADSAAGITMRRGAVDAVVVGADRITLSGDVANKIGTYQIAVLARENGVPFYVAAPTSTIDLSLRDGDLIPIEERAAEEITSVLGVRTAPGGVEAANPAFDVTPNALVAAIITENGVATPPYDESLPQLCAAAVSARG